MSGPRFSDTTVAAALGVPQVTFLGAGSFGDTWQVGSTAVKILCVDGYPQDRVDREVSGLRRVNSDHVVKLLDTGTVNLGGKPRTTLTFEYVPGGDLQDPLDAGRRPSPAEARALLLGLLTGLRDMHSADGTVHRDIKPQNVALRDGRWDAPVILDLGLAKAVTELTVTQYPARMGTAFYMSPEQLTGDRARKASDLFSVGVTVRHVITGAHPFYPASDSLTWDDLIRLSGQPPAPLPADTDPKVVEVLDILVSVAQHERRSAGSALRRLETT